MDSYCANCQDVSYTVVPSEGGVDDNKHQASFMGIVTFVHISQWDL